MGTKIKELVVAREVALADLGGKTLVVDAFNTLYQFLSSIRQADGTLLMDSHGKPTSHLSGLFSRSTKLMANGIRLAFVFDGRAPDLKKKERERRAQLKEVAAKEYEIAKGREDIEGMRKYAARTTSLSREMIDEAKALVSALGMPVVQAPAEGEAQAALLVKQGQAYAEVSQDFDCLLFGVPRMLRNVTVSERRKLPGQQRWVEIKPELIELQETLKHLGITQRQLIALGMLIGTDYNYGGIKGIGPKHGLKLVQKHGENFASMFAEAKWDEHFITPWEEIMALLETMPVDEGVLLQWGKVDADAVAKLLCDEHDFSRERVVGTLAKLDEGMAKRQQKGLSEFL